MRWIDGSGTLATKFIVNIVIFSSLVICTGGFLIYQSFEEATVRQVEISSESLKAEQNSASELLEESLRDKANIISTILKKTTSELLLTLDYEALSKYREVLLSDPDISYVIFFDEKGSQIGDKINKKQFDAIPTEVSVYLVENNKDSLIGSIELGINRARIEKGIERGKVNLEETITKFDELSASDMRKTLTMVGLTMGGMLMVISIVVIFLFKKHVVSILNNLNGHLDGLVKGGGDLTIRIPVGNDKNEITDLATKVNAFLECIHFIVLEINKDSNSLREQVDILKLASTEMASESEQQLTQSLSVATAVNEMSVSINEISKNTQAAAEETRSAEEISEEVASMINDTVAKIQELYAIVTNAAESIRELDMHSSQIGEITSVISTIAGQTNLLALNAAIEAARAGEQGKGFAVVADEVRTLAEKTQSSTQDISAMISQLQEGSKSSVQVMEVGCAQAELGMNKTLDTGKAITRINETIREVNSRSMQIAAAAEEQNTVTSEIDRNISHIKDASDKIRSHAEKVEHGTTEMFLLVDRLNKNVANFRI